MATLTRRVLAILLALALSAPAPSTVRGQPAAGAPSPSASGAPDELGWPRSLDVDGASVLVYQPQIDRWDGDRLDGRLAVGVRRPGANRQTFGVVWFTARTEVDKAGGLVQLEDVAVPRVSFPASPRSPEDILRVVRQHLPPGIRTVPLAHLQASLAAAEATAKTRVVPVVNDPPRIVFSATPALLVRVDGQPVLRQIQGSRLMRVINTRALILLDQGTARYYLYVLHRWLEGQAVEGPWAAAVDPPAALEAVLRGVAASGQVDLLDEPQPGATADVLPTIYVSTVPTELIVTRGEPEWSPIPGTELLYLTNTTGHVFLELRTQDTYVLIAGRWFRAKSTSGPWEYVPGRQLPPDFARIPEQHPQGSVLTAVPGTPQAQEAVIANSIPQTATVNRSEAHLTVTYDGSPQFRPVQGTLLQYAVNSPTPVIRVDAVTYYALSSGVWFVASAPVGPWVVATVVPAVIYTIPPASPLHYVTYVHVYGSTPAVVYVGYTPGYLGTVVTPDGVVVYGTGVVYTPWVGTVWYPPPATYGSSANATGAAAVGFMMGAMTGMAIGAASWGWCCSNTANVNITRTVNNYDVTVNGSNVYNTWGSKTTVSSGDNSATVYRSPDTAVVTNNQNNNVYASHDGNVYRKENGSYEKWDPSTHSWDPVQSPRTQSPSTVQSSPASPSSEQQRSLDQPGGPSASPQAQSRASQRAAGEEPAFQPRAGGQEPGGRFTGGQGLGGESGNWLDRESMARQRGFERFGAGFGRFRR